MNIQFATIRTRRQPGRGLDQAFEWGRRKDYGVREAGCTAVGGKRAASYNEGAFPDPAANRTAELAAVDGNAAYHFAVGCARYLRPGGAIQKRGSRARRASWPVPLAALVLLVLGWAGACGSAGGGGQHDPGTPKGTFTLTVAGTSGGVSHTQKLTLTVN